MTANCCQNLHTDELHFVSGSLSALADRLTQYDKKSVESICVAFSSLVDSIHGEPERLLEMASTELLENLQELLVVSPPVLSSATKNIAHCLLLTGPPAGPLGKEQHDHQAVIDRRIRPVDRCFHPPVHTDAQVERLRHSARTVSCPGLRSTGSCRYLWRFWKLPPVGIIGFALLQHASAHVPPAEASVRHQRETVEGRIFYDSSSSTRPGP